MGTEDKNLYVKVFCVRQVDNQSWNLFDLHSRWGKIAQVILTPSRPLGFQSEVINDNVFHILWKAFTSILSHFLTSNQRTVVGISSRTQTSRLILLLGHFGQLLSESDKVAGLVWLGKKEYVYTWWWRKPKGNVNQKRNFSININRKSWAIDNRLFGFSYSVKNTRARKNKASVQTVFHLTTSIT